MKINCHSLNKQDYERFCNDFVVLDANVDSLEEATDIFIGESHNQLAHKIKASWLLKKLAKKGDILSTELPRKIAPFVPSRVQTPPGVLHQGWDSYKGREQNYKSDQNMALLVDQIRNLASATDRKTMQENFPHLCKILSTQKEIYFANKQFLSPDEEAYLDAYFTQFDQYKNKFSIHEDKESLQKYYLHFLNHLMKVIGAASNVNFASSLWTRNVSLANAIEKQPLLGVKKWYYGGRAHFFFESEDLRVGAKKAFEPVSQALKGKKYVVLTPTDQPASAYESLCYKINETVQHGILSPKMISAIACALALFSVNIGKEIYKEKDHEWLNTASTVLFLSTISLICLGVWEYKKKITIMRGWKRDAVLFDKFSQLHKQIKDKLSHIEASSHSS